ncbi:hypothetical protein L210DRAFT_3648008 [Boletus edulis BED1]|uniref:C2H2-type domain-containing protein n=1 Tax=Boletus edulis BED1 TaxID=1328754 RepID=A0AAD4GC17_BOLED|nr:hypothetical protein L210DRAFT_3648008 [Boletus edulis BED1]
MGKVKSFACTYENCGASFHRRYELKKHRVDKHEDPSKLLHKKRKVPPPVDKEHYPAPNARHTAAISRQESFYGVANNNAALSAPESSYNSWSETSRSWEGSTVSSIASYTSNYDNSESTNTYATVQLSAAEHPLVNRVSSQPNILHGRVPRASYAQKSTDATSASTSQHSYGHRGVNLTGNYSVNTSAETPENANAFTRLGGPNQPGVQSSTWGSVASRTTNSSPYTTNSFPRVEPPFKNGHFEQASQYASTDNGFVGAPAVQSNHASSTSVASYTAKYYNSESEDSYAAPQSLSAERNFGSGLASNLAITRSEASNALASIHESPAVESIYSSSVALHATNSYSLPYQINSFPRVELPSNNVHLEQASSYDNSPDNGFIGTPAVQSNDTNSSSTAAYTASLYNSESKIYAVPQLLSAESHLDNGLSPDSGVPRAEATNALASTRELAGASQSIVPSINATHRGVTGHHLPDIMIYMDVEQWDSYILDAQRKYTHL